ncbi:mediator of RNA polymerase II transcription subunit 15-like isoform X2 [Ornithorhynchus anatinus]|uniref:mediator of RNA polymerase II transcription subunit 15-like isoform X2 n=1 Tax=Ornithorhynchus anatinus TaxID=9258 RepID=UPI0019D4DB4C|nr:mediator of RNA polymerase II transcription subunit 15-like isoform X2 [Ornithorhynchus anatinus]
MEAEGQDWRSAAFRQKLVSQIDDVMRKAGVAHSKSSKDMESHVFLKAKNREEYLSLVARIIIHFRDIHYEKSQASVAAQLQPQEVTSQQLQAAQQQHFINPHRLNQHQKALHRSFRLHLRGSPTVACTASGIRGLVGRGVSRRGAGASDTEAAGQDDDWRGAVFRQKLLSQIDDAVRKAGVPLNKSSEDMESYVFLKAKTREEYLSLVARLIIHFRNIYIKKCQASGADPVNAQQNLTDPPPAGAAGFGVVTRSPGQPLGEPGELVGVHQATTPSGQPSPGTSGMAPRGLAVVSATTQQTQLQQVTSQLQQVSLQQQQFQAQNAIQQQFPVEAAGAVAAQQPQQDLGKLLPQNQQQMQQQEQ